MNDVARSASRFRRPVIGLAIVALSAWIVAKGLNTPADDAPVAGLSAAMTEVAETDSTVRGVPALAQARRSTPRPHALAETRFGDRASALAAIHEGLNNSRVTKAQREQTVAALEDSHHAEAIDSAWSAKSEVAISRAAETPVMTAAGFKPRNVATDCRSRTCRISASFDSSVDARDWAQRLLVQMGGTMAQARVTVLPQGDGSFEVRVYGVRRAS